MADMAHMIPHILRWETGKMKSNKETLESYFLRCKVSGYGNDPDDLGGATMCGVTIATYRAWRKAHGKQITTIADLKAITYNEWFALLKQTFWDRWRADEIVNQSIAEMVVDWMWGSGKYGITEPQKVLGVVADGIVGKKTLAAINTHPVPHALWRELREARLRYYERICRSRPANRKFLRGWKNRVNSLYYND